MKAHGIALALVLLTCTGLAAQTVQKCCGTENSTFLLGNTSLARHTQSLYLPSDLTNAANGMITRLYFRYGNTGQATGVTLSSFAIHLGQTTATAFVGGNTFFTDLTVVQAGPALNIQPGTTGDWFSFPITPFPYNAGQTLILDIWYMGSDNPTFGTLGSANNGRKLYANDLSQTTGTTTSSTWQDLGFDITPATSVADPGASSFTLLPLPGYGQWQVQPGPGTGAPAGVRVMDATGKLLLDQAYGTATGAATLDLSTCPAGLYLVQMRWRSGQVSTHRLLRP